MDDFYRSVETSLLALGLALGLAVAMAAALPVRSGPIQASATLPMIEVFASGGAE